MSVNAVNKNTGELVPLAGKPIQDAGNINYTNTTSHLSATKVQGAIDEVASIAKAKFIGTTSDWNNLSTAVKKTYDEVLLTDDFDDILDYITAGNISYDNTDSGLLSNTVQDAITELSTEKQEKTDTSLTTTDKTVPGAINELKSGLNNLADDQASDLIAVASNYHDGAGRVYHFIFEHANNTKNNRMPIMIQTASQSGATKIIAALVKASADDASVACSDSDVTYTWADGVLDVLVDCGNSAWASPYIYMRRSLYQSMV